MLGLQRSALLSAYKKAGKSADIVIGESNYSLQGLLPRSVSSKRPTAVRKMDGTSPNYFVCVRFSEPELMQNASEVQSRIIQKQAELKDAAQDFRKLHITLCVMRLSDSQDIVSAINAMNAAHRQVKTVFDRHREQFKVHFSGVGSFRNRVLFAEPRAEPLGVNEDSSDLAESDADGSKTALQILNATFTRCFQEEGLQLFDVSRPFTAHATLFKLSKLRKLAWKSGSSRHAQSRRSSTAVVRTIDDSIFAEFADFDFGSAKIERVQLCDMQRSQADGFYEILHEVDLHEAIQFESA